jgi:hypothetical protein
MTTPWIGLGDADLDYVAEIGDTERREGYEEMMDMIAIYEHTKNRLAINGSDEDESGEAE